MEFAVIFGLVAFASLFGLVWKRGQGRVVTVHVGELHAPQAEAILSAIAEVDGGRASLEAARSEIERALSAIRAGKDEKKS